MREERQSRIACDISRSFSSRSLLSCLSLLLRSPQHVLPSPIDDDDTPTSVSTAVSLTASAVDPKSNQLTIPLTVAASDGPRQPETLASHILLLEQCKLLTPLSYPPSPSDTPHVVATLADEPTTYAHRHRTRSQLGPAAVPELVAAAATIITTVPTSSRELPNSSPGAVHMAQDPHLFVPLTRQQQAA